MSFDKKIDLTAGVYFYLYSINVQDLDYTSYVYQEFEKNRHHSILRGLFEKFPITELNEDTHPVLRAIGVTHAACKNKCEFRRNLRSHRWECILNYL